MQVLAIFIVELADATSQTVDQLAENLVEYEIS